LPSILPSAVDRRQRSTACRSQAHRIRRNRRNPSTNVTSEILRQNLSNVPHGHSGSPAASVSKRLGHWCPCGPPLRAGWTVRKQVEESNFLSSHLSQVRSERDAVECLEGTGRSALAASRSCADPSRCPGRVISS